MLGYIKIQKKKGQETLLAILTAILKWKPSVTLISYVGFIR
jgi:hypothetical protein